MTKKFGLAWVLLAAVVLLGGCGASEDDAPSPRGKGRPGSGKASGNGNSDREGGGARPWARDGAGSDTAVPVEVAAVARRNVSSFLETNGALEAENDVRIVARTQGPIVELAVEEGMRVGQGQLLLRIDDTEHRAQVEIAKVALAEATRAHDRARASLENEIISREVYDQALARLESAQAQLQGAEILYAYTRVVAPFRGVIVTRFVKFGETVSPNQELFRLTDFDPLLCKIQLPERELPRLGRGQKVYLEVEAWPGERFEGEVLRISPVVEAATGTIQVTLQVQAQGKLRPGMFARVSLVTDTHANALVMPKAALSLESLSDTVFVVRQGEAVRRAVTLGYEERDVVEVLGGLEPGERVIVVGQDGLTDGTPVQVLKGPGSTELEAPSPPPRAGVGVGVGVEVGTGARPGQDEGGGSAGARRMDISNATPEQIERMKERMRERGMTEQQIEERIQRLREQSGRERASPSRPPR